MDDDASIREALDDLMLSCGYKSRLYSSAEDFLADADVGEVDCMLVDVKMSGMSGIELQKTLNERPRRPPMVFMTSYRDKKTKDAAIKGGALGFLGKPVDFAELVRCIEIAIRD